MNSIRMQSQKCYQRTPEALRDNSRVANGKNYWSKIK